MADTIGVYEAKTHLSRLLDRVAAGEEIVIARAGKPIAKLVPLPAPEQPQRLGLLSHIKPPPDSFFFDPLSKDELRLWGEGREDENSR